MGWWGGGGGEEKVGIKLKLSFCWGLGLAERLAIIVSLWQCVISGLLIKSFGSRAKEKNLHVELNFK